MGVHHFYYGMVMILVAFVLAMLRKRKKILTIILFVLGFIIAGDDGYQHIRHEVDPAYRSPVHKFYNIFYERSSALRKFNHWLDGVFGKPYEKP